MNDREQALREALDEVRVDDEGAAEDRAWRVVAAAGAAGVDRPARRRRHRWRAAQVALVAALIALVVSPAGASVRHWVADRIEPGAPRAVPVLSSLPGHGSLLVDSAKGPWVVHPDGSKRLLGDYAEASWSPHGLYAVVTRGHELSAVEPDGIPRWTLTRPGHVALARWNGPDGFRIAYLEGRALRVVDGDGTDDRFIAGSAAAVAPAWRSGPGHEVAFATERGAVVVFSADSRRRIFTTASSAGPRRPASRSVSGAGPRPGVSGIGPGVGILSLQWTGDRLLVTREDRVELLGPAGRPVWTWTPPPGSHVRSATVAPGGDRVAVVTGDGHTSRVLLIAKEHRSRVLFAGPGNFAAPSWSPEGRWLLLPWTSADQWLFLEPGSGTGKLHAVAHLAKQFSPGAPTAARFPSVVGWCCTVH
jgi:WD40-like Beta Propeller Repeat